MAIAVVCPHCDAPYMLQPELVGRSMRCTECRDIFTVEASSHLGSPPMPVLNPDPVPMADAMPVTDYPASVEPIVPESPKPERFTLPVFEGEVASRTELPYERIEAETMEPIVPIFEGEAVEVSRRSRDSKPTRKAVVPSKRDRQAKARESAEVVPYAEIVAPPPESNDGPKEVMWDESAPVATPQAKGGSSFLVPDAATDFDPDELPTRRRRGRGVWPFILLGLIVAIMGGGIFIAVKAYVNELRGEQILVDEATEEFKKQNHPAAAKLYDQLVQTYPASEKFAEYEFFAKLSNLLTTVSSPATRENPADGQKKWTEFLTEYSNNPLAKPDDGGFGYDVFEAGRKLTDALADHSDDQLKNYRAGYTQPDLLAKAEKATADGRALIPVVEKYRIKEIKPLDEQRQRFDELSAQFVRERERIAVLAPFLDLAENPTDQRIAAFSAALKQSRFESDAIAQKLIATAKASLRNLIRVAQNPRPAQPVPNDPAAGLIFVSTPQGVNGPPLSGTPDAPPEVVFANSRGVVYAFDAETGVLLWAARTGSASRELPLRVPLAEGGSELALLPTETNGEPGIVARNSRTGQGLWYQPLEGACAGPPVRVGSRVYLPLRDELGTIVELDASSGNRLSQISIRQRIGPGAVVQPGTSLIYVAAEARRLFVLEVDPRDADGNRQPLRCVHVLATDHPDLSLKVPPIITGPDGDGPAFRILVLAQCEGTQRTRLRGFPLPPITKPENADTGPAELIPTQSVQLTMPGHVVFSPAVYGERIAIQTDSGAFGIFGTNPSNPLDPGLFPLPSTALPNDTAKPIVGQVAFASEDRYWVLSRSLLTQLRVSLTPDRGLFIAPPAPGVPLGIPVQPPQRSDRRDWVYVAVRSETSDAVRFVAFDQRDGRLRWHRALGITSALTPLSTAEGTLVSDDDGAAWQVPLSAATALATQARQADPAWLLAPSLALTTGAAKRTTSSDGKRTWILVPEPGDKNTLQLRIRLLESGKLAPEQTVALPDRFAGEPIASGSGVVLPLADGFLYRYEPGTPKLIAGPMWRGEGTAADAVCYLAPLPGDDFCGTNGGKQVTRWRWSSGAAGDWRVAVGPWTLREPIAFAPVAISLGENATRLFVADQANSVWLFDADKLGEPLRRWRGTALEAAPGMIPVGKPTLGFTVCPVKGAAPVVCYTVDRQHIVALSTSDDAPLWVSWRGKDDPLLGIVPLADGFAISTDFAGKISAYDTATGTKLGTVRPDRRDTLPRAPAVPFGPDRLFLPLADGTAVFLANPVGDR